MFKSDTEVDTLIGHKNNRADVKIIGHGQSDKADRRNSGPREHLTTEQKASISVLANVLGVKATTELTGKNQSQVSNIKAGKNGVGKVDPVLRESAEVLRERIQSTALSKADQFLEMLGIESDLKETLTRATITEKVVNIYEKLAPKNPVINDNRTQIVFYAPRTKESAEYPVIEVETQNG
jgi:hypothetical protein